MSIIKYQREERCRTCSRGRRHDVRQSQAISLDDGLAAELPERRPHLCQIHSGQFPNAKIGILSANDDFGKDALKGFLDGLGDKANSMVVVKTTYESSDPTVDLQILKIKDLGADFANFTTPKFAAMAIKKIGEWAGSRTRSSIRFRCRSAPSMKPAGLENAKGIVTAAYGKDPDDPAFNTTRA